MLNYHKKGYRGGHMKTKEELQQYLNYCEFQKTLDSKTLKAYRIDLKQYLGKVQLEEPSKQEIENYIAELHKKYKQKTVKRKIASIKAFYNYLEEEEIIESSPFRKIKVKFKENITLPRVIPRKEIEILLNSMYAGVAISNPRDKKYKLRDLAIVELFFATGARVYEISNIKKECVDLDSGLIRIMGKGGKERYIQIAEDSVITLLRKYSQVNAEEIDSCGYFFVNQRGQRFSEQSIRLMLKNHLEQAEITRKITPHMFRHSFATYLLEEGVDVSYVQRMLGHSSINTTQIYIHVAAKKQAEILRNMHPRKKMNIISG